jgi:hypothetical protein
MRQTQRGAIGHQSLIKVRCGTPRRGLIGMLDLVYAAGKAVS